MGTKVKANETYVSRAEVLLTALLSGVEEDLQLSNERMELLKKNEDLVSLRMEREMNKIYVEKKEKLKHLVELEKSVSSGVPHVVTVGYLGLDGNTYGNETYIADKKEVK
ncbi:hypothetical protein P9X10_01505 [Bacillus cereus]|nr:hypothetical protein [Bacillus cereus]